jgi:hypothetical protein
MEFSKSELDSLRRLSSIYQRIKTVVLYSEEIDENSRSNIQIIKELRDSFDHILRVFINKFNLSEIERETDYNIKNLDKSLGHLYRASFDALDGVVLSLKEQIKCTVQNYNHDVIVGVLGDEYWKLKTKLHKLDEDFTVSRSKKDSGDEAIEDIINNYIIKINDLKEIRDTFEKNSTNFSEYKKNTLKKNIQKGLKYIITAIIGAFIYAIVNKFFFSS